MPRSLFLIGCLLSAEFLFKSSSSSTVESDGFGAMQRLDFHVPSPIVAVATNRSDLSSDRTLVFLLPKQNGNTMTATGIATKAAFGTAEEAAVLFHSAQVNLNGVHLKNCVVSPCIVHLPPVDLQMVQRLTFSFVTRSSEVFETHDTNFIIMASNSTSSPTDTSSGQHSTKPPSSSELKPCSNKTLQMQWARLVGRICGRAPDDQSCLSTDSNAQAREKCSGHGRCSREGFCFCLGDWIGHSCGYNVLMNATYLPESQALASALSCAQALRFPKTGGIAWRSLFAGTARRSPFPAFTSSCSKRQSLMCRASTDSTKQIQSKRTQRWNLQTGGMMSELDALQHTRCSPDSSAHTVVLDTLGLALGGQINLAALALAHGYNIQNPLVMHGHWKYGDHSGCLIPGRACYFRSGISCSDNELQRKVVKLFPKAQGGDILQHTDTQFVRGGLKPPEAVQAHGLFWWTSIMVNHIVTASHDLQAKVRLGALQAGLVRPSIGLHIRRGDACVHAAQSNSRPLCSPIESYIPPILSMQKLYSVSAVFLSTDDESVFDQIKRFLEPYGIRVATMPLDRSVFQSSWFIEHRVEAQALDAQVIADSMLVDLLLLRECDWLVGTLSSQMSRLALMLITHRLGFVPPYASVDGMGAGCCTWAGENLEGYDYEAYRACTGL